jgi:hypothetical protein
MAHLGGQRSTHWHFYGEIGEKTTQKYRYCYMSYHILTQAPNVSSILVVSGRPMKQVDIIWC